jgi:hypothetical protein
VIGPRPEKSAGAKVRGWILRTDRLAAGNLVAIRLRPGRGMVDSPDFVDPTWWFWAV